jgi:predicted AlkP superfamily pyrophosphatase or phosphodiesterase
VPKKVILAVVDGLGPAVLDGAIETGNAPTLRRLQELGERSDGCVSTFPSLTPVCLSALVTGEHPVGTRIPSMSWYHRGERRFVEYGSSFSATLAEGTRQMVDDVLVNLNLVHLSPRVETLFETLEDRGLITAAVNCHVCRGRVRHPITIRTARRVARRVGLVDAVYAPSRYFFGELFSSEHTGAPRNFGGGVDRHSGHVGRWLVTRDGFDFLFLYLYETDAVQHRAGDVMGAVRQADASIGMLIDAAGGEAAFLERYGLLVVADHGQSAVEQVVEAAEPVSELRLFRSSRHSDPTACDLAVAASNRVAMAYMLPSGRLTAGEIAHRFARHRPADVVLWQEGPWFAARRESGELRFRAGGDHEDARGGRWSLAGDRDLLDPEEYPNALERIAGAVGCATAGDVIVSAAPGVEFRDAGGVAHAGGGSHGSLHASDSLVPLIAAGIDVSGLLARQPSITDLAPYVRGHFAGTGAVEATVGARSII